MHRLLEITENSQCQDPRDKVYGLLGLANDYEAGEIRLGAREECLEARKERIAGRSVKLEAGQEGLECADVGLESRLDPLEAGEDRLEPASARHGVAAP